MTDKLFSINYTGVCDDHIDRQHVDEAISRMNDVLEHMVTDNYNVIHDFCKIIDIPVDVLDKEQNDSVFAPGWKWELADNRWADHVCPFCGFRVNDDIHVHLNWKYCPNCGRLVSVKK